MKTLYSVLIILYLFVFSLPIQANTSDTVFYDDIDTIHIIEGSNNIYFSNDELGISHIHFLGKGMRYISPDSFFSDSTIADINMICSNMYGIHENPDESGILKINDIYCSGIPVIEPDTSKFHTKSVIFDSFFEDAVIIDSDEKSLFVSHVITYIPVGYSKYELLYIQNKPYIIIKSNIDGTLYTEWFQLDKKNRSPLYYVWKYAAHGTVLGLKKTIYGLKEASNGTSLGLSSSGYGITTGIGKAVYNESRFFYRPSPKIEYLYDLLFDEKPIEVERNIIIYTYFFKSKKPKANVFLVHGNGGNVSTYINMIKTLVFGNYNVYVVDWRGYGKSTGTPEYNGVLKDTEFAFNDFLNQIKNDSLKVFVYGMSLGGQIATKITLDKQEDIDALILDGSLSSAQNLAIDFMPAKFIQNNMKKNGHWFNQAYVAERDIAEIENMPKLIIHSESDNIVSFYHGERLFENAREPKLFWKTNTQHIKTLEELPNETIQWMDRLLAF